MFKTSLLTTLQRKSAQVGNRVPKVGSADRFCSSTPREKLTTSYVCGPGRVPLLGITAGQLVQRAADLFGDQTASVFVAQKIRKTFHQTLIDADQAAAGLLSLGLKRGDRIGIWGPNSYEWISTQWAAARAGLILVNINPGYRANELRYALNKVEVKALVLAETVRNHSLVDVLCELLSEIPAEGEVITTAQVPSLERVIVLSDQTHLRGALRWKDVVDRATPTLISDIHNLQRRIQFDDPLNIQFTSGTTGQPKGACLSHHNMINNAYLSGIRLGYRDFQHTLCLPLPLYHAFAGSGVLAGKCHGFPVVFPGSTFNSRETVEAIQQEKCTAIYGAPTMIVDMLHLPNLKDYDLSSLSLGLMGGAPVPMEVVKAAERDLHIKCVMIGFGMTESSVSSFCTFRSDSFETRCSTVGYPSDHVEVKIIDPLTDEIVPVNTPGEILTRGYSTMLGYWNDPTKTSEIITKDRWLRSGDIGVMDEYGYGKIVGRMKDMIIRGGENIFPREIEEILHTHPSIQEAHVVGVPDTRMGEEVCAWVRCRANTQLTDLQLKEFCRDKLAHFKIPRYWLFKDAFPVTVTGKVQKFIMRDTSVKELGL